MNNPFQNPFMPVCPLCGSPEIEAGIIICRKCGQKIQKEMERYEIERPKTGKVDPTGVIDSGITIHEHEWITTWVNFWNMPVESYCNCGAWRHLAEDEHGAKWFEGEHPGKPRKQ